jgi:hypothetical protein
VSYCAILATSFTLTTKRRALLPLFGNPDVKVTVSQGIKKVEAPKSG